VETAGRAIGVQSLTANPCCDRASHSTCKLRLGTKRSSGRLCRNREPAANDQPSGGDARFSGDIVERTVAIVWYGCFFP